ncbi:MAG: hypothetical protein HN729_09560 [Candidatus Marinimicrobia bacterium]|jgi:hypothetical protein|nr:hypothetical protein [Candidatus Neomarinimicrobiota bacterium]MBT3760935.1 hypothetical protein [Candidatus Neomarinimicrobiota bacterium]MBT4173998.1 hypothetical protein [Candidatus Neomarinimicrobiota bacterium]MBT4853063.1 hypothetical protein [Candidatus Neomarinimicrobiota bacterium]MBT5212851.1 hypothetical protein [Candidatus Neomarinimicrobiota bacterium]
MKISKIVPFLLLGLISFGQASKESPVLLIKIDLPNNIKTDEQFGVAMTFESILNITSISYALTKYGDIQIDLPDEWTDTYSGEQLSYNFNITVPSTQTSGFSILCTSKYESDSLRWNTTRYFDVSGSSVLVYGGNPDKLPKGVMQFEFDYISKPLNSDAELVSTDSSDINWELQSFDSPPRLVSGNLSFPAVTGFEKPHKILILLFIDKKGIVKKYNLLESSGYANYDEHVIRVSTESKWEPALKSNTPIDLWIIIPIEFPANSKY